VGKIVWEGSLLGGFMIWERFETIFETGLVCLKALFESALVCL